MGAETRLSSRDVDRASAGMSPRRRARYLSYNHETRDNRGNSRDVDILTCRHIYSTVAF